MNLIEKLVSWYPNATVTPQDFIDHLTPGCDGFGMTLLSVVLAVIFGLLVYIYPIILNETEHEGPYPVWMHTFYCAADFMGIWVFLSAWIKYDHFYMFLLLSIGEAIWVCMEIYSLQRAMTYEKDINWKSGTTSKEMLRDIIFQVVIFLVGLNLLRVELGDLTMWKFWIFTQVLVTVTPGLVLEKRGYRTGNCRQLNIAFICVAIVSFNPWCNMWVAIAPEYFSMSANPWYYIMGAVCLFFAIRGAIIYEKLPEKNAISKITGRRYICLL